MASLPFMPTFPTEKHLNATAIAAKSTVAVRGMGLTWIDATLAMTEGRGGAFENIGGNWLYHPSGDEPMRILPYSRSGRPMLAKPDESLFIQPPQLSEVWERGSDTINRVSRPVGLSALINEVWRAITVAAAEAAHLCGAKAANHYSSSAVGRWFDEWRTTPMAPANSLAMMRESFLVATGQSEPGIAWALGAAWRNMYSALVRCLSYDGLAAEAWPKFREISVEMERIAFGPPAENVGRILALVEVGIVDLSFLTGSVKPTSRVNKTGLVLSSGTNSFPIDHLVDAVIPSPLHISPSGPIQSLLDLGLIHRLRGGEGIEVNKSGRPVDGVGKPVHGLAILGRVTEGCVLGNDTLSRTLHDLPDRWADSIIQHIQCSESAR